MCHLKSWLKNVSHRDRSERCGITSCWSLKKLSLEKPCLANVQKHTCMSARSQCGWRRSASKIVCGHQMCVQVIISSSGARIADNYNKKENPWLGVPWDDLFFGWVGHFWFRCTRKFADGIQILPSDAVPGEEVFSYLDLDDEIIELSITPNRADAFFLCVGWRTKVATIWPRQSISKTLRCLKQISCNRYSFCQHWHSQGILLCRSYLEQCDHHQVHNGCKIFSWMKASVNQ